jgi:hypothetical protein
VDTAQIQKSVVEKALTARASPHHKQPTCQPLLAAFEKGDYKTAFSFYNKTDAQDVSEAQLILGEWVLEDVVVSSQT